MSPSVHGKPRQHYSHDFLDSPIRGHSSPPQRRSSPWSERSPPRRKSSPRPRSPVRSSRRMRSPAREKIPGHGRSPKYESSISPPSESPSPRSKRMRQAKETSKEHENNNIRIEDKWLSKNERSKSYVSRSPSPRSKRLRGAQMEREAKRAVERGHDKNDDIDGVRRRHTGRISDNERSAMREKQHSVSSRARDSRHGHSSSPTEWSHRNRYGSRSPARGISKDGERDEVSMARGTDQRDGENDSVSRMKAAEEALATKEKQMPSFELSGKLAAETNRFRGVTLLFSEPSDACKPNIRWRLYVLKAGEVLNDPLYVHRQSCYLFGRERRVADIPTDHPSCSKQHAVIQYRRVEKEQTDGMLSRQIRPYLMDLGSTNGTFINDNRIEPQRYYELFEKDSIRFGNSSREYVILHEDSV